MYQRVRGRISDPQQEALGIDGLVPKLFANVWDALGFRILLRTIFGIGMSSILKNEQKVSSSNLNSLPMACQKHLLTEAIKVGRSHPRSFILNSNC